MVSCYKVYTSHHAPLHYMTPFIQSMQENTEKPCFDKHVTYRLNYRPTYLQMDTPSYRETRTQTFVGWAATVLEDLAALRNNFRFASAYNSHILNSNVAYTFPDGEGIVSPHSVVNCHMSVELKQLAC